MIDQVCHLGDDTFITLAFRRDDDLDCFLADLLDDFVLAGRK